MRSILPRGGNVGALTGGGKIEDWSLFPARVYLDQHYGRMSSETAAMMSAVLAYVRGRELAPSRVVEVAGGPTVFSLLALTAALEAPLSHVVFTDIAWSNLQEVDDWLHDRPQAFDYAHLYEWLATTAGADPERAVHRLRAARWELVRKDWHEAPAQAWIGAFDAVSSHFFVESATGDRAEALGFVRNYAPLARPDALVLLSFLQRASSWDCDGFPVTSLPVDESTIESFLCSGGLKLRAARITTAPSQQPAAVSGYDGVVTVSGMRA